MKMRTLNEAASELGLTRAVLRRRILDGEYPSMQWGNRYLVDVDVLREMLEKENADGELVGIAECAEAIGVSESTLRRMAQAGVVPYERVGRVMRYRVAAVKRALSEQMDTGTNQ